MMTETVPLIYSIFHLNLAFSSIEKHQHVEVVKHCYWPLLNLVQQQKIPVGIELTAYTLDCIQAVDPLWIQTLSQLAKTHQCEVIASGDSQIIGPLIPAEVNEQNLRLGQQSYQKYLSVQPKIAYINEQAVSAGLLDCYLDQGYEAVVMEWDNPYSDNENWHGSTRLAPQTLLTASGRKIKVIWNHAIAFQKFQRYVHHEMTLEDYQQYLQRVIPKDCEAFIIYGSDVEVFDFRPGRYQTESTHIEGEWLRIAELFHFLSQLKSYQWALPIEVLARCKNSQALVFQNASHPISVKKQPKYNVTRWALSGRNDLWLNTQCYKDLEKLNRIHGTDKDWRDLCRFWASDLRTHLTQKRYDELLDVLPKQRLPATTNSSLLELMGETEPLIESDIQNDLFSLKQEKARGKIHIKTEFIELTLNTQRGLAIEALAFKSQQFTPIIGTLAHGFFDEISYGADFYSNHLVMERFRDRDRVTDLSKISARFCCKDNRLYLSASVETKQGVIRKNYRLQQENLSCEFEFENKIRPEASIRLGYLTLLNCQQRSWFATHNGGKSLELFEANCDFDHGHPISSIVSANNALGATQGVCYFGNGEKGVAIHWCPADCAALPMLSSKKIHDQYLNRYWFSLAESDETLKAGGTLLNFKYSLSPCTKSQISGDL